jgi:hypothetical protein
MPGDDQQNGAIGMAAHLPARRLRDNPRMSSTARIAMVFLATFSVVGLCACDGRSPSSPTARTPVVALPPAGTYSLTLLSGASDGCSGGNRQDLLPGGVALPLLRFEWEGSEWVGRLLTPVTGDFELRLQMRGDQDPVTVAGTMRGQIKLYPAAPVSTAINQPATMDGRIVSSSPAMLGGTARGELVYEDSRGRTTCSSATWSLTPASQP